MINKIHQFIQKFNMLEDVDSVIIGLSGGADSVGLLLALNELRESYNNSYSLYCVHVNHNIRGEEAIQDMLFCQNLCKNIGIECQIVSKDIPNISKKLGLSEEEAGRIVRYDEFSKAADKLRTKNIQHGKSGKVVLAVAHHMNDQAETIVMNFIRGSGIKGLCGMQPVNMRDNLQIIRPLLSVTRGEIETYLNEQGQSYQIDSTNLIPDYTRNKIRINLLPYLQKEFNSNIIASLCGMADNFSQAEVYLEKEVSTLYRCVKKMENKSQVLLVPNELSYNDKYILSRVIKRALCEAAGHEKDIYKNHVNLVMALFNQQVGKRVCLPYGLMAVRCYEGIEISKTVSRSTKVNQNDEWNAFISFETIDNLKAGEEIVIPVNKQIATHDNKIATAVEVKLEIAKLSENYKNNIYTKYFDCDTMKRNIYLRFRKPGDTIAVKEGTFKKIKKEFIDKKVPEALRQKVLLVTDTERVLWAIGIRRGEDHKIHSGTKRILKISVKLRED